MVIAFLNESVHPDDPVPTSSISLSSDISCASSCCSVCGGISSSNIITKSVRTPERCITRDSKELSDEEVQKD